MPTARTTKETARDTAYKQIHQARAARFPFPIEGRIPNFRGAEQAAARLARLSAYVQAKAIKVNPDAPQLPVRARALRDGKTVYMPSPRLRGGFIRLCPKNIPPGEQRRAASLSHAASYGEEITVTELARRLAREPIGLIVVGSVAVTAHGKRAGKGEGYADMEYAVLRQLGMPPVPVVTTVHEGQIVDDFAVEGHDLWIDVIATPDAVIHTDRPHPNPDAIDWDLLTAEQLAAMPFLAQLKALQPESSVLNDLLRPGLSVVFVGINPGQRSADTGHNFAGPGNHFWRLLHEAGFTPHLLAPQEENVLPTYGIGLTNVVERPTRGEADLSWDEMIMGGIRLRGKIDRFRPGIVALLGKNVYRAYAGLRPTANVQWGLQKTTHIPGVVEFVAPNPSARSTIPFTRRLELFRELHMVARPPKA